MSTPVRPDVHQHQCKENQENQDHADLKPSVPAVAFPHAVASGPYDQFTPLSAQGDRSSDTQQRSGRRGGKPDPASVTTETAEKNE
jgi:hypothetical protein